MTKKEEMLSKLLEQGQQDVKIWKKIYDKDTHTLQNQLDIANADRVKKVKDMLKELNIDIERNKRREIQHNKDGSLQMKMIAYDPEMVKMRLLKLLESEE